MNLRPHMVLVALLAAFAAWAQGPSFVYFRADAPLDASAYKMVLSQLMDLDPQAEVFHSDDMTILQVKRGAVSDEFLTPHLDPQQPPSVPWAECLFD